VDDFGLDEDKFYSLEEVQVLRRYTKKLHASGRFVSIRTWFMVDFDLNSGLRVEELADLRHGDLCITLGKSHVEVQSGKGGKRRIVLISESLRRTCEYFCRWKKARGLSVARDSYVFTSYGGHGLTKRALQKAFTRCAAMAGLHDRNIHRLRHTYTTYLLEAGAPLPFVQRQLGHASISSTQRYAGVAREHIKESLNNLDRLYTKGGG